MGIPWEDFRKHDRRNEISDVICPYWRTSLSKTHQLFGSDAAIKNYMIWLQNDGYKKGLFRNARTFVADTILSDKFAFMKFGEISVFLVRRTNSGAQCWDCAGRFMIGIQQRISVGLFPHDALAIEMDIEPIYKQLEPFLLVG